MYSNNFIPTLTDLIRTLLLVVEQSSDQKKAAKHTLDILVQVGSLVVVVAVAVVVVVLC